MFSRRTLTVGLILGLMVVLLASLSVAAQEKPVTLSGSASFRDAAALSDSLVIDLGGVGAPAVGTRYEGWLKDASDNVISVGALSVSGTGAIKATYVDPDGTNLLATYQVFLITAEPDPDPSTDLSGVVVYSDIVETDAFAHVGHLVVTLDSNPDGKGVATGLREQASAALSHAQLAKASGTLADKQSHAQHVINIVGGGGAPGDGYGILAYAADATTHAGLVKEAAPGNETVLANADVVIASASNITAWAEGARTNAQQIVDSTSDNVIVEVSLNNLISSTTKVLNGRDVDGDGKVRPFNIVKAGVVTSKADEGGANLAYTSSQDMAQFVLLAGDVGSPGVGDALVPPVMLGILLVGFALTASGGFLMRRRREGATA
jgi:hypothetical protein